jgi:hypothetical protein
MKTENANAAKHTRGPWLYSEDRSPASIYSAYGSDCIAKVYLTDTNTHKRDDEHAANARLIAAAPELLEACEQAEYWLDNMVVGEDDVAPTEMLRVLRAAIARATGAPEQHSDVCGQEFGDVLRSYQE